MGAGHGAKESMEVLSLTNMMAKYLLVNVKLVYSYVVTCKVV